MSASLVVSALVIPATIQAQDQRLHADKRAVVEHWTPERRAAAIPRDLVIDAQGRGYLRRPDGSLEPYGQQRSAQLRAGPQVPNRGKPGGGGGGGGSDTTSPAISNMIPGHGATIGADHTFKAAVTDDSGLKSVNFVITFPSDATQSYSAGHAGNGIWTVNFTGFSDGDWGWHVVAKDNAGKGGNTATSDLVSFTVNTGGGSGGGGGGGGSHVVTNAPWCDPTDGCTDGGAVQTAAGRIYFEMPSNPKWKRWAGYVCSGTVATDNSSNRSVIITAAHCVYDDANKAFARHVMFIPDQAFSGTATDRNCSNDRFGCWLPSFGVVDVNWTTTTFPNNVAWDYAYYVVDDTDDSAHDGPAGVPDSLEDAVGALDIDFTTPQDSVDNNDPAPSADYTHALGYSYSDDPNFMYCAEDMTKEGTADVNWWLPSCGLSGGASGGPWVQPMDVNAGNGQIISVNSWGYTTSPGMAGPYLNSSEANCLFGEATRLDFGEVPTADGAAGLAVDYCN
ncbi:MAG: hypothetical protein DRR03_01775 [Gammaproteobacteria bacterium]|nr:MAG: hypothetical protein DRR03_01775 [Gammaproteobacteria bacterium]